MTTDDLDEKISALMAAVASASAEPPDLYDSIEHRNRSAARDEAIDPAAPADSRRPRALVLIAGMVILIVVTAALMVGRGAGRDRLTVLSPGSTAATTSAPGTPTGSSAAAPVGPVRHEVIDYRLDLSAFDCGTLGTRSRGVFDAMRFEAWGDEPSGRYQQTVTYPDGQTRSAIELQSPYTPSVEFTRGEPVGRQVACDYSGSSVAEPGQGTIFTLNPLTATVPTVDRVGSVHPGYRDLGSKLPGTVPDSTGEPRELWRQIITGTVTVGAKPSPVTQTHDWYVDPTTGLVHEETYRDTTDAYGTMAWRATLIDHGEIAAPADLFDTAGFSPVTPGAPSPAPTTTLQAPDDNPPTAAAPSPTSSPMSPEQQTAQSIIHSYQTSGTIPVKHEGEMTWFVRNEDASRMPTSVQDIAKVHDQNGLHVAYYIPSIGLLDRARVESPTFDLQAELAAVPRPRFCQDDPDCGH